MKLSFVLLLILSSVPTYSGTLNFNHIRGMPFEQSRLLTLEAQYIKTDTVVMNNGCTIQSTPQLGNALFFNKERYRLLQFHFHSPSRNLKDGKSYPLEGHFVHANNEGQLLIVSVLYEEGTENKILEELLQNMPKALMKANLISGIDLRQLMPDNLAYYRLDGSLTTLSYVENITWIVLKQHPQISQSQIERYRAMVQDHLLYRGCISD